jgi:putative transposase
VALRVPKESSDSIHRKWIERQSSGSKDFSVGMGLGKENHGKRGVKKNLAELRVSKKVIFQKIEHLNNRANDGNGENGKGSESGRRKNGRNCKGKDHPINFLLQAFGVSKSGFYHWLRTKDEGSVKETDLRGEIERIVLELPRYGYRRVTKELRNRDFDDNAKRVLRVMRENNLLCEVKRAWIKTTDSNHRFPVYPNLIKELVVERINQVWVADITYIRLLREFVYLAAILDSYSRKVVGWALSRHINAQLTLAALKMALKTRDLSNIPEGEKLIHHSDRGVQYAAQGYTEELTRHGVQISMAAKGNPFENAQAESFMKTLKWEEVYLYEYENYQEALDRIGRFIEDVYNQKRLHSSIGYKSPNQFEAEISNIN